MRELRRGVSRLFSFSRGVPEELDQVLLPQRGVAGRRVAARLLARRYLDVAAVLHALDLALHDAELGRVAFVIGGVDRDQPRPDALQAGLRVVILGGLPLVEKVVRVAAERLSEALRHDR